MRCPKCGYITFDYISSCSKCKTSFKNATGEFQGTTINVTPPSLLGSITKSNSPIGEVSVDEMLEGHDFDLTVDDTQHDISNAVDDANELMYDSPASSGGLDDLEFEEMSSLGESLTPVEEDDKIPTLMPVSEETDDLESNPRLERLSSDLGDIDLSDLVSPTSWSDNEGVIPSLQSMDSEAEEIPTLEPLAEDELYDIPSLSMPKTSQHAIDISADDVDLQDLDLPSDLDLDDDISTLLDDSSLDDLGLDTDNSIEFGVQSDLGQGSPLSDFLDERDMAESSFDHSFQDNLPPLEPQSDGMSSFPDESSQSIDHPVGDDLFSLQDFDGAESQKAPSADSQLDNFDLSFDDSIESQALSEMAQNDPIELTLELDDEPGVPLKTQPKNTSMPSIPDLGLKLESDSD